MKTDYVRELKGTTCRCGAVKVSSQTFCRHCYFLLPVDMRQALYRFIGEGYEEAYDLAAKYLDQAARTK